MTDEFIEKHCDERHTRIDEEIERLWQKNDEMQKCIESKFSKLFFLLYALLGGVLVDLLMKLVK